MSRKIAILLESRRQKGDKSLTRWYQEIRIVVMSMFGVVY